MSVSFLKPAPCSTGEAVASPLSSRIRPAEGDEGTARKAEIAKQANCHLLRGLFATLRLEDRSDSRTVQECLGDAAVRTTMINTYG